jgi:hypothetical protein
VKCWDKKSIAISIQFMRPGGICDASSTFSEQRQAVRSDDSGDQTRIHEDAPAAAGTMASNVDQFVSFSAKSSNRRAFANSFEIPKLDQYDYLYGV